MNTPFRAAVAAVVATICFTAPDAARAQSYPVHVRAGHFGLVVGRAALSVCWPTVVAWTAWHDGRGERPAILDTAAESSAVVAARNVGDAIWDRMGKLGLRLGRVSDTLRWQFPSPARLASWRLARWVSLVGDVRRSNEAPLNGLTRFVTMQSNQRIFQS